jgi:trimethylguanosine synthase
MNNKIVFESVTLVDVIPSARGIGYDCVDVLNELIDFICQESKNDYNKVNLDKDDIENLLSSGLPLSFSSGTKKSSKKGKKRRRKHDFISNDDDSAAESKIFVSKYKQKILDKESNLSLHYGNGELVEEKYWDQRFRLMTRFDEGVLLDAESWYSITPEAIANHITQKCIQSAVFHKKSLGVACDFFSGCGGNSISLGKIKDIY